MANKYDNQHRVTQFIETDLAKLMRAMEAAVEVYRIPHETLTKGLAALHQQKVKIEEYREKCKDAEEREKLLTDVARLTAEKVALEQNIADLRRQHTQELDNFKASLLEVPK